MEGHVLRREECQLVSEAWRQGRLWTERAVGLRLSRFGEGGLSLGPVLVGDHDMTALGSIAGRALASQPSHTSR